jgi:hypothetical protein
MDQCFHVLLHGSTGWRRNLVVLNLDRTRGHLVETLVNDAEGLTELFHTAQVPVITVAVDANRNIELYLVVCVIWLGLADIPRHTGTSEHDTGEGVIDSIGCGDNTDTLGTSNPDTVVRQHLFGLINAVAELGRPLMDIVEKAQGKILRYTTRDTLVEFLAEASAQLA